MADQSDGPGPRASRPRPAEYFSDANAGRGLLPWSHALDRLVAARNYWVATASPDGRPHCMPVWGVWLDPELVFSTSPASRKARNLRRNARAVVHLESGDQVVVVEGVVSPVDDPAQRLRFIEAYNPKYSWSFTLEELGPHSVFALRPRKAFAWLDSGGDGFSGAATRWIFEDATDPPCSGVSSSRG